MIQDAFRLDGRVALVTGGSKGIGKAIARAYVEAGADVAISARHGNELQDAAEEIRGGVDRHVAPFVADMTDRSQVSRLAADVVAKFGKVDVLVNNAGSNQPQALVDTTDEVWDRIVELNLTSCMILSRALAPQMIERKWGRIIYMSSIMAVASNLARGVYSATKAGLCGMTRSQALELGPHGITVNCIGPGPIMTDLPMSLLSDEQKEIFAQRTALKRWGEPAEMAGPALLLASDAGAYISGTMILADGGLLCRTFD